MMICYAGLKRFLSKCYTRTPVAAATFRHQQLNFVTRTSARFDDVARRLFAASLHNKTDNISQQCT